MSDLLFTPSLPFNLTTLHYLIKSLYKNKAFVTQHLHLSGSNNTFGFSTGPSSGKNRIFPPSTVLAKMDNSVSHVNKLLPGEGMAGSHIEVI